MKRPQGPVPTLAQLQNSTDWTWLYCDRCLHRAPMKFAPLIARWGANASSGKNYIETVWGRGYVLREPSEEEAKICA